MSELRETIADEAALMERLLELSRQGGAWVFAVLPFTHTVLFRRFASPSRCPDEYITHTDNRVSWKNAIVSFSPAALIREQNRGITCD